MSHENNDVEKLLTTEKNVVNPIQWFPGHMAKTRRLMKEYLPQVDIVLELLDARAVLSSRNPEIMELTKDKPLLTILNKSGLADEKENNRWLAYYKSQKFTAISTDCKTGAGMNNITSAVREILKEKLERYKAKGMEGRRLRAMIVGIPNVGKSSFLNKLCKNYKAKVEDRPGVTLRGQWVSAENGFDLLDMPGVLWPKFESAVVGNNLAYIGSIKDQVVDTVMLAVTLCGFLSERYREYLLSRFKLTDADIRFPEDENKNYNIFCNIGKKRGFIISGGKIDEMRCASVLLDEFRSAKIGRISLETIDDIKSII